MSKSYQNAPKPGLWDSYTSKLAYQPYQAPSAIDLTSTGNNTEKCEECYIPKAVFRSLETRGNVWLVETKGDDRIFPVTLDVWSLPQQDREVDSPTYHPNYLFGKHNSSLKVQSRGNPKLFSFPY